MRNQGTGPADDVELFEWTNTGEVAVEPYELVLITTMGVTDRRVVFYGQRHDVVGWTPRTYVNGPTKVDVGKSGACSQHKIALVRYEPSETPIARDQTWGPSGTDGKVHKHIAGSRVITWEPDTELMTVFMIPNQFVMAKLNGTLQTGRSVEATAVRWDVDSRSLVDVRVLQSELVTFDVYELTGEIDDLEEDTVVFTGWYDPTGVRQVVGFVCG